MFSTKAGKLFALPAGSAASPGGAPPPGPQPGTVAKSPEGDASLPDPTPAARTVMVVLLIVGALLAWLLNSRGWTTKPFVPAQDATANFALFAGFYVGAQIIERVGEAVSPLVPFWSPPTMSPTGTTPLDDAAQAAHTKADRAAIMHGITFVAGVGASCGLGLFFLGAIGMRVPHTIDAILTGLTIAGGTKAVHDFTSLLQNAEKPKTGTGSS